MANKAELIEKINSLQEALTEAQDALSALEAKPYTTLVCYAEIENGLPVGKVTTIPASTFYPNVADLEDAGLVSPQISITALTPAGVSGE